MSVVTIRGYVGSGAPEIGKMVAENLGIDYVDREIIADVAERLRWLKQDTAEREMQPGTLSRRIFEGLSHISPGKSYTGTYAPTWEIPLDDLDYLSGLEFLIKELAEGPSIVIRGRGSQFILKDYPVSLHVLVVASVEDRLKRTMESLGISGEQARIKMERSDSSRREFTRRYFRAELDDPWHYDMVVNTSNLSYIACTSLVLSALSFRESTYGARLARTAAV
jgi:cytidylate kinase